MPRDQRALGAFLASLFACSAAVAQITPVVPVKVLNGTSVARSQEPVNVGIPVSSLTPFYQTYGVRIVDPSGAVIPAQFKVLSRWGGLRSDATKPIKWVLASFRADVPADGFAEYQLALAPSAPAGGLIASSNASTITVSTTPNTHFTLDRLVFSVFKTVMVDGVTVVNAPGSLDFRFADGSSPTPTVSSTELEEYAGPWTTRCVVRQKGSIGALKFTARWYFYSGRKDPSFEFRLENSAAYGLFSPSIPDGQQYFQHCYVNLPVAGTSHLAVSSLGTRPLVGSMLYKLEQDFAWTSNLLDVPGGFFFTETLEGSTIASGGRYDGGLDVSSTTGGVTVTVDRFWQNFPKSLHAQSGMLKIGLWPEYGEGPFYQGQYAVPWNPSPPVDPMSLEHFRFEGGRWKTHKVVFDFHAGGARTPPAVATEAIRAGRPLAGLTPGSWTRRSWAMHTLWTERQIWPNALHNRYEKFYDIMVDDNAAESVAPHGKIGYPGFLERGGTNGGNQNYGWDNFGDLTWADGYSALHYDMTESVLSGFLRTGDYRFFDRGRDLAAYRRDFGQNHSTNTAETWRGAQFYEKGWWHGNYVQGQHSHNWVAGLLLHYVLTGDEGSYEAAIENLAFTLRDPPKNWNGYWGSRIPGWAINCLLDGYNYVGNPTYLTEAGLGVAKYQTHEMAQGSLGRVLNAGTNPQTTKPWMENIFFNAAAKYVLASHDETPLPLLGRMSNWFKNTCIQYPTGTPTAAIPASVFYEWGPTFNNGVKSIHLLWPMCESFAYSAAVFNDPGEQLWAALCFETVCRYWQSAPITAPVNMYDVNTWSKMTFKPAGYPGTESKVFGNLLRWAPAHLTVQRWLDNQW